MKKVHLLFGAVIGGVLIWAVLLWLSPPRIVLHVVDATTGAELTDVWVIADWPAIQWKNLPLGNDHKRSARSAADSPVNLTVKHGKSHRGEYLIAAEGYASEHFFLNPYRSGEYTVALHPGADLYLMVDWPELVERDEEQVLTELETWLVDVSIEDEYELPRDEIFASLTEEERMGDMWMELERLDGPYAGALKREDDSPGETTSHRYDGLSPGMYRASLLLSLGGKRSVLGRLEFDVNAGVDLALKLEPGDVEPEAVGSLVLELVVPASWHTHEEGLRVWLLGDRFQSTVPMRVTEGVGRHEFDQVPLGKYVVSLTPPLWPVEIEILGPEQFLRIELPELLELTVNVVNDRTGEPGDVSGVWWGLDNGFPKRLRPGDLAYETIPPDSFRGSSFRVRAPAGRIGFSVNESGEGVINPYHQVREAGQNIELRIGQVGRIALVLEGSGQGLERPWLEELEAMTANGPGEICGQDFYMTSSTIEVSRPGAYELMLPETEHFESAGPIRVQVAGSGENRAVLPLVLKQP